ncbi:MAG TPA: transporter [Oligoflexus sp.]|uniref:transporter n=1 Tax=Oligoflexus sp. TaxID=1971216 RepID=UPI002D7EF96E|nr:transporter [Oligoflexus sp.]HET9241004.1 transporter [Oligoflexus sp.]
MKSMVASHRGTARLTSKLLVLGLCLGFHTSHAWAQDEETPTPPPAEPAPATDQAPTETPAPTGETPADSTTTPPSTPTETAPTEEGLGDKVKDKVKELKEKRIKNRKETTDAVLKRRGKDPETAKYVMLGEAQTLPEKVARFRYVRRNVAGNQTFEEGGNKKDVGIDAVINVNAYVLEYGLTDKISLQLLVPTIASADVTINAEKFSKSKVYAKKYKELMDQVVPFLQSQGQCTTDEDCLNKINNEAYAIPTDSSLVLPTGEVYTVKGGIPVERAAYSLITNAAKPQKGKTGLSDIMLAALFNVYNTKEQMFSVGAGVRLPTGEADDEKSYNRTGSGFTTLGLALKYDYRIIDPLMVSFSNQTELHVKNPNYKRHSLVDPDKLNEADPNVKGADLSPAVPGDGDGVSNNFEVSRKGVLNTGYVRLGYALGALSPALSTLSVLGYYNWNFDPETYYDGVSQHNASRSTSISYALGFDGLGLQPRIPVGVSVSQERMLTGENVAVAAVNTYFNLVLYYKF